MILRSVPPTPPVPERRRRRATPARRVPARHRRLAIARPGQDSVLPPVERDPEAALRPNLAQSHPCLQRLVLALPLFPRDGVDEVERHRVQFELQFLFRHPPGSSQFAEQVEFPTASAIRAGRRLVLPPAKVEAVASGLEHPAPENPAGVVDGVRFAGGCADG